MFKCDVCGRELNGITIVNGMSFCAKCYQETFVIPKSLSVKDLENCVKIGCQQCNQKDQRIAELEKENEEKEDKILDLKSYNSDLKETISKLSFSAVRCQAINDEVCQYILDNELLKKENAELKIENNEFCDYNKKLRKENQTAVKEFAEKLKTNIINSSMQFREANTLIYINELLKERGIE